MTIDPLVAFFGSKTDAHRDQDVRRVLAPLAALAESTGAAVVAIRHLNKNVGGNALYRGGGSIGFIAAAGSGLLVAKDPEDDARRVLAPRRRPRQTGTEPGLLTGGGTERGRSGRLARRVALGAGQLLDASRATETAPRWRRPKRSWR